MPEPLHPPFASGALLSPRTLMRWLDVNPQGGPLTRTMTYLTLPVFNADVVWSGFSDIVTAFNFEASNNFSIKAGVGSLVTPNFTLCISYRVGSVVTRYIIWQAAGSVMDVNIPFYEGQLILKNFRFEVWSTTQGDASQATAINFFTSVSGQSDYRWGGDAALVGNDGQVVNFFDTSGFVTPYTIPPNITVPSVATGSGLAIANVIQQWDNAGFQSNHTTWVPTFTSGSVVNLTGINAAANNPFGLGFAVGPSPGISNWTCTIPSFDSVIIAFIPTNATGYILRSTGHCTIHCNGNGTYSINGQLDSRITTNTKCTVVIRVFNGVAQAAVYRIGRSRSDESDFVNVPYLGSNTGTAIIVFDNAGITGKVAELVTLETDDTQGNNILLPVAIVQQYLNWLNPHFTNMFALPITFPNNAVSTSN